MVLFDWFSFSIDVYCFVYESFECETFEEVIDCLSIMLRSYNMVRISVLNDALKSMYNAEKRGKRQVMIRPSSKVVIKFLLVMQKHGKCSFYSICI